MRYATLQLDVFVEMAVVVPVGGAILAVLQWYWTTLSGQPFLAGVVVSLV